MTNNVVAVDTKTNATGIISTLLPVNFHGDAGVKFNAALFSATIIVFYFIIDSTTNATELLTFPLMSTVSR